MSYNKINTMLTITQSLPISLKRMAFRMAGITPDDMPMVKYWKMGESVTAKLTKAKEGHTILIMEGEDQPLTTYPRGHILFGKLSKLKHEIKNQIFNYVWKCLDDGTPVYELTQEITGPITDRILNDHFKPLELDLMPSTKMSPMVQEVYRAWTKVDSSQKSQRLRDMFCLIIQEDDSYRFRVQWLATYFNKRSFNIEKSFERALEMAEHGEVIDDMKERERLWRRTFMLLLKTHPFGEKFKAFLRELDWSKIRLSEADKYHFRAKYFKVDLDLFEY